MRMRIPHAPQPDLPDIPLPEQSRALAEPFAALARLRREIAAGLPQGLFDVAYDPDRFAAGETLLAEIDPLQLLPGFLAAAEKLLPAMAGIFPPLSREAAVLGQALAQGPRLGDALILAFFADAAEDFESLGAELGIRPEPLLFLTQETVSTVLRAEASRIAALADDELWRKNCCPICGSAPDLGWLKEQPEPSEFLIAKAGRLMLHCSLCGHLWRFPRLTCPTCGETDHEKLELFMPEGRERERIHACTTCRRYFVVTNRVDSEKHFDPDATAPALAHLDAAARARGFEPVCVTPWNQLDD